MNYGFTKARVRLESGAAIVALSAGAAMAQEGVEQVVVSSTRLQAAGFDAPTPTTVISPADLEGQAKPNVFDSLKDLPALQGSTGASAQATPSETTLSRTTPSAAASPPDVQKCMTSTEGSAAVEPAVESRSAVIDKNFILVFLPVVRPLPLRKGGAWVEHDRRAVASVRRSPG